MEERGILTSRMYLEWYNQSQHGQEMRWSPIVHIEVHTWPTLAGTFVTWG